MSTMIERVARALQKADGEKPSVCAGACTYSNDWRDYIDDAVTAIAAMREPTPHMYIKGGVAISDARPQSETYADESSACWTVMIDAALQEKPEA